MSNKTIEDIFDNNEIDSHAYGTEYDLPKVKQEIQALITEKMVKLANLYGNPRCANLHHDKKNQHTATQDCPAEIAIYELLKENK